MQLAENHLIVCRDPVKTWATNYVDWRQINPNKNDIGRNKNALAHQNILLPCWKAQNRFLEEWQPHVHRVDIDTLETLGEWIGIEFTEEGHKYSTPSRMKDAVMMKDIDKIEWLCQGTNYWTWFKEEATPVFADFYEKQGYDIWWTNG